MSSAHARQVRNGSRPRALLAAIALMALLALVAVSNGAAAATEITLLHDTHFHAKFDDDGVSLAHYAALVNRIRSFKPNTFFVGVGDDIGSSYLSALYAGRHITDALNAAGLDVNTFGNHDFDYGPDNLAARVAESEFVWVSANVLDARTGRVFAEEAGARRFIVVEVDGVGLGFTGIAPHDTKQLASAGPNVAVLDPAAALMEVVPQMRAAGADIVVVLSHEAWPRTETIAAAVPGVHVYVGDHSGQLLTEPKVIGGALVSRVGDEFDYLGELTLRVEDGTIVDWSFTLHDVRDLVDSGRLYPDVRVERIIQSYAAAVPIELDMVIGVTHTALDARTAAVRTGETNLGNFVADALRTWGNADIALQNGGGLRGDAILDPGPITRGDVLGILPFDNYAVKLRLTGRDVLAALELGVSTAEYGHGRFPQVSGLTFTFDPARPPGERVSDVRVGDAPLDPERWYTVATNNYIADGGDGYDVLRDAERIDMGGDVDELISTIVIRAILEAGEIAPEVEGRIVRR